MYIALNLSNYIFHCFLSHKNSLKFSLCRVHLPSNQLRQLEPSHRTGTYPSILLHRSPLDRRAFLVREIPSPLINLSHKETHCVHFVFPWRLASYYFMNAQYSSRDFFITASGTSNLLYSAIIIGLIVRSIAYFTSHIPASGQRMIPTDGFSPSRFI